MHRSPDPMSDKLSHDTKSIRLDKRLNRAGNIYHTLPSNSLRDAFIKRTLCHIHQLLRKRAAPANRDRLGCIADISFKIHPNIDADDIAKLDSPITGKSMNDLVIYRKADIAR